MWRCANMRARIICCSTHRLMKSFICCRFAITASHRLIFGRCGSGEMLHKKISINPTFHGIYVNNPIAHKLQLGRGSLELFYILIEKKYSQRSGPSTFHCVWCRMFANIASIASRGMRFDVCARPGIRYPTIRMASSAAIKVRLVGIGRSTVYDRSLTPS